MCPQETVVLELPRKAIVLTAIFALLLPSLCLAKTQSCSCSDHSTADCQCCCGIQTSSTHSTCPHCRTKSKPATDDGGYSIQSNSVCHCEVTAPLSSVSLFNWDASSTDGLVTLALEADLAPYVSVCSRDRQPLGDGNSLPLPEPRFRQIVLCVWLT